MGMIGRLFDALFGGGRNIVVETAQVFRENAEQAGAREAQSRAQAMSQFGAEFRATGRSRFDRLMDGLNRLPRPLLAYGTLGLFVAAMLDPVWFASRMQGISLVPDPLWWLMGAIVSFYFGARHQAHAQDFQRSIAETMARVPMVVANTRVLEGLRADSPRVATTDPGADLTRAALEPGDNPALEDWHRTQP